MRLIDDSLFDINTIQIRYQSDHSPIYMLSIHHQQALFNLKQELKEWQKFLDVNVNLTELLQSRLNKLIPIELKDKSASFEGIMFEPHLMSINANLHRFRRVRIFTNKHCQNLSP